MSGHKIIKERPILFSAPMVRAILDGRKTMTRRAVKPQPWQSLEYNDDTGLWDLFAGDELCGSRTCPYGQPGDRLWVRETWAAHWMYDDVPPREIPGDGESLIHYQADGHVTQSAMGAGHFRKSRPSIHMPRWASRITLEITDVRVERLQEISEQDAKAEGAEPADCCYAHYHGFNHLWQSINGPGSWEANPWVWVIEFNRIGSKLA